MFSKRTGWNLAANRLAAALDARRRAGREILDLTISNPTRAGIEYPAEEIAAAMAAAATHVYDPEPRGLLAAREAIAAWYAGRGLAVEPERIVLTASTSEAYAWLFKLLCNPGDHVLVPRPSYPLFEYLARLESIAVMSYPLRYDGRWEIDRDGLLEALDTPPSGDPGVRTASAMGHGAKWPTAHAEALDTPQSADIGDRSDGAPGQAAKRPAARAIVLVNPNNPTGSYVSESDLDFVASSARAQDLALISDEVFAAYPLDAAPAGQDPLVRSLLGRDDVPLFVLDGLSKSAGLPGMKAGWIVVHGPRAFRECAIARLEIIADTYLSVGTPVQRALPRLIAIGRDVSDAIRARTRENLDTLREAVRSRSEIEVLRAEGGWSAVLRVPATQPEETLCLDLLEQDGVLVQPGWYFDFDREAYLVLSLLTSASAFRNGIECILRRVSRDSRG